MIKLDKNKKNTLAHYEIIIPMMRKNNLIMIFFFIHDKTKF